LRKGSPGEPENDVGGRGNGGKKYSKGNMFRHARGGILSWSRMFRIDGRRVHCGGEKGGRDLRIVRVTSKVTDGKANGGRGEK